MRLKPGQSVRHFRYGWGAVLESDRDQTTVYFHSVGIKKFVTSLATFAVVEDQEPGKKRELSVGLRRLGAGWAVAQKQ